MKFGEALEILKAGAKVRVPSWSPGSYAQVDAPLSRPDDRGLYVYWAGDGRYMRWSVPGEYLLADDWEELR